MVERAPEIQKTDGMPGLQSQARSLPVQESSTEKVLPLPTKGGCSSQGTSATTLASMIRTTGTTSTTHDKWKEPPIYPASSIQGDRKKLTHYITALKLWVKVSGVEKKNQAIVVKYNAYQDTSEYFDDLDSKFGD